MRRARLTECEVVHTSGLDFRDFRNWHDPAHMLVGIFAGRQPKLFGAFLTLAV
jgi:hypothetical protein